MSVLNHNELAAVCSKYRTDVNNAPERIKQNIWTPFCNTVVF